MPFLLRRFGRNVACEVQRWQFFLRRRGLSETGAVDGDFGQRTEAATRLFQRGRGLPLTGALDAPTLDAAAALGYTVVPDTHYDRPPDWPPRPADLAAPGHPFRTDAFGCFKFTQPPRIQRSDKDGIIIGASCDGALPRWEIAAIERVRCPELAGVPGGSGTSDGGLLAHRLVAPRILALFRAWDEAGLLHLVRGWSGAFSARYKRDQSPSDAGHGTRLSRDVPALSNHAYGSAFDINVDDNPFRAVPAPMGARGCVRELVPIANAHGFFWGGHFQTTPDGMHFELARL
jgi:hypothetical protein